MTHLINHHKFFLPDLFTVFSDCWTSFLCEVLYSTSSGPLVTWVQFWSRREKYGLGIYLGELTTHVRLFNYKFFQGIYIELKGIYTEQNAVAGLKQRLSVLPFYIAIIKSYRSALKYIWQYICFANTS